MTVTLTRESLSSPVAQQLISALNAELSALYPEPGATHFVLTETDVAPGNGIFLVARIGEEALGCGALRRWNDREAELKRMYVADAARGRGIGRALLEALEAEARRLGVTRMVLETGIRQTAAEQLYRGAGYVVVPTFPQYESPIALCMAKML